MTFYLERYAEFGDAAKQFAGDLDFADMFPRFDYAPPETLLPALPIRAKCGRVPLESLPKFDYFDAHIRIRNRGDLRVKAEPVEKLRPQVDFLVIARTDQNETRRVADAYAFAFDYVDPARRSIEKKID